MMLSLPSVSENMVNKATYFSLCSSLSKFLRMTSGYSLNSMKKFWLAFIRLNYQSLHSNKKLKYIYVSLVSSIRTFLGVSCSDYTTIFTVIS